MAETINLGIVGIKNMGEYDSQTNYEKLNVVTYQGSSYCALKDTKGNLPTNSDYWQLYAEKGGKGDTGSQGPKPVKGVDYYTSDDIEEIEDDLSGFISEEVSTSVGSLVSATPLAVTSISDMTDTTRIYVLSTDGHWYWYDGDSWEDGGVYQAAEDSTTVNGLVDDIKNMTNKLVTSYQLVDESKKVVGRLQSDGSVASNDAYANYYTTDYIPIDYTSYTFRQYLNGSQALNTITHAMYDNNKDFVSGTYNSGGAYFDTVTTIPASAKYIRFSYFNTLQPLAYRGTVNMQVYEPYEIAYYNKMITNYDKEKNAVMSKVKHLNRNVFNPDTVSIGKFISGNGLTNLESYNTSDFIPVTHGEDVSINFTPRDYCFYDINKNAYLNLNQSETNTPITINPDLDGYIRLSYDKDRTGIQVEYGSSSTSYVAPNFNNYIEENTYLSNTLKGEIIDLAKAINADLQITLEDNDITIESSNNLKRTYTKAGGSNKVFNYAYAYLNNTTIKGSSDDIAPQRIKLGSTGNTQWTVGANHGWPSFRVAKGSLTNDDIGSIWTDGTTQTVLLYVDSTYAYFSFPCSKTGDVITIITPSMTSNLVHVSGATHTSNVSISGITYGISLPESLNHISLYLYVDEREITENGTYHGNLLTVKEHYEITDYYDLIEYLKNHIGYTLTDHKNDIKSIVGLDFEYVIDSTNEVIHSTITALENVTLANSGLAQAFVLSSNSGTVYRYVNGVNAGVFKSDSLVNMETYSTSNQIFKSQLIDSNIAVNRCVDICVDGNNDILYGFTFGFIPDKGDGADEYRKDLIYQWEIRDTKKSYPYCFYNKSLAKNEELNVITYRSYILPNQGITNKTTIPVANNEYLFIDAHNSFNSNIKAKTGYSVESINDSNINYSSIVGAKGVSINSNATYSNAVLKTK